MPRACMLCVYLSLSLALSLCVRQQRFSRGYLDDQRDANGLSLSGYVCSDYACRVALPDVLVVLMTTTVWGVSNEWFTVLN